MNIETLASRVQTSRLLSETEKQYWLGNLKRMLPEQICKLESILGEAEALPWTQEVQNYLQIATKTPTTLSV